MVPQTFQKVTELYSSQFVCCLLTSDGKKYTAALVQNSASGRSVHEICTWCGRKVMRLATLCTKQQCCCLPLHMALRLTPAVDSVQVWTCYSCCAIVESVWSEVVFV